MMKRYEEERGQVPSLPSVPKLPDLTHFTDNQLGVAAFTGERMLGYLCTYTPWEDVFGTTGIKGTFSPIHAHGVIGNDELDAMDSQSRLSRGRIYSLLYQEAARKWVGEGIRSHAVAIYSHDKEAINSFFFNGFGFRCMDLIRSLEDIPSPIDTGRRIFTNIEYSELPQGEWVKLLEMSNALITHLGESPIFMKFPPMDVIEFNRRSQDDVRYFAAKKAWGLYCLYQNSE